MVRLSAFRCWKKASLSPSGTRLINAARKPKGEVCHLKPPKLSSAGIPKKCKAVATSTCSKNSSPTIFVDHTPQPNMTPEKDGARGLYRTLRAAFPDFHADIHWQAADGELVTTYKTYHGTHEGTFLGIAATGRKIHFETVDVMRVHDGKITEHCGVANLFSLIQQLGAWPAAPTS